MAKKDAIHLVLPISPDVALVFCDASRCWQSPFADIVHQLQVPYPVNSLLRDASHKDVVQIRVPSEKRSKKTWPATMAWRVSIGALSWHRHRIIASYSLSHADSFVIVRHRARFEKAKRELELFSRQREETWKSQGVWVGYPQDRGQHRDGLATSTPAQATEIVDGYMASLNEVINLVGATREPIPRTKEMAVKSWQAICALNILSGLASSTPVSPGYSTMNPRPPSRVRICLPAKTSVSGMIPSIDDGRALRG